MGWAANVVLIFAWHLVHAALPTHPSEAPRSSGTPEITGSGDQPSEDLRPQRSQQTIVSPTAATASATTPVRHRIKRRSSIVELTMTTDAPREPRYSHRSPGLSSGRLS